MSIFLLIVSVILSCYFSHELVFNDKHRGMNGFLLAVNLYTVIDNAVKLA